MSFRPFRALAVATAVLAIFALAPAALAAAPGADQITGAKLVKALLPVSYFGRGYTALRPIDSGSALEPGQAAFDIASMRCTRFWNIYGEPALGETALALGMVGNRGALIDDEQVVYQLPSTHAASSFYGTAYITFGKCRLTTLSDGGGGHMYVRTSSVSRTRVGRYSAFLVTQVETFSGLPGARYSYTLFALDGYDAFILKAGTPTAGEPDLAALVARLISRVSALH